MRIEDLIGKCMETPGISMKKGSFCTELLLHQQDGRGSMVFFPLFPGVTLAYIFVNSPSWPAPDLCENSSNNKKSPLIFRTDRPRSGSFLDNSGNFMTKGSPVLCFVSVCCPWKFWGRFLRCRRFLLPEPVRFIRNPRSLLPNRQKRSLPKILAGIIRYGNWQILFPSAKPA